jgi:hypothetical protein
MAIFQPQNEIGAGLSNSDWIAVASAIISVIALLISVRFAKRAEEASRSANAVASGEAETNLRAAIRGADQWLQQCNIQIVTLQKARTPDELSSDERSIYDAWLTTYDKAAQQLLGSYDEACARFLDGKIDGERFLKSYRAEIRDLCEKQRGTIHKLLHPKEFSNYKAIWSVYVRWTLPKLAPRPE